MKYYVLLLIALLLMGFFMFGCKSEITNNDNWPEYKEKYLGKRFIIKPEHFLVKFHDNIVKEKMIVVPGDLAGLERIPSKKDFLDKPTDTYLFKKSKIISLEKNNSSFKIIHAMYYRLNSSSHFLYFIVESLENKERFAIEEGKFSLGIKDGYIQIIE